jgi:hypothetical protein
MGARFRGVSPIEDTDQAAFAGRLWNRDGEAVVVVGNAAYPKLDARLDRAQAPGVLYIAPLHGIGDEGHQIQICWLLSCVMFTIMVKSDPEYIHTQLIGSVSTLSFVWDLSNDEKIPFKNQMEYIGWNCKILFYIG